MSVATTRSAAACALVARSAARAASWPSSILRTSVISIASASEISLTRAPRLRSNSTRPWADSSCRADRARNREVPNRSHRSISTSRCPGAYSPRRIAERTASTTASFGSSGISPPRGALPPGRSPDRRRSVRVERGYGGQAPGLALGPLGLGPAHRRPVGGEDQPGARVAQLDPVPAWLVDVEEERLLDRVLVRAGLDEDALVQADVRGTQDVFPGVGGEREMVQPPGGLGPVVGVDQVVGLLREVQPLRRDRAVVEHDLLGDPAAERVADELPVGLGLRREEVDVVQATDADSAAGVGLGLVLQRGLEVAGRSVPLGLEVQLELVPVGIAEQVGRADTGVAVLPADAQAGRLDRGHPAVQCLLAGRAQAGAADARGRRRGQLQAVVLVVVPGAQVDRVAAGPVLGEAEHLGEEPQALVRLRGEQFRVGEVGYLMQQGHRASSQARSAVVPVAGRGPGKTIPSKSLRAVRTTPARRTAGGSAEVSSSTSTVRWPVGCSTSTSCPPPAGSASSATEVPTPPGSSSAVATLTAPSTPIAVCGRTGMNVLVQIVPPSRGELTRVVLGTDRPLTSPSPISLPAAIRSDCTRAVSSPSAASSSGASYPPMPRSPARATTTGMPLSTQVTSTPSTTSRTRPVGSRLPVAEPAVPAKRRSTGAAEPGTPAISVPPA